MKRLCFIFAIVAIFASAIPAQAQFRFGLKAGMAVNSLHFNKDVFDASNRAGFTGGAMVEFTVPGIGIGADLSVMYVRRSSEWLNAEGLSVSDDRDYIDIPLNFKWRINIPVINNIARPFLTTGPSFAILTSKRSIEEGYRNKKFDTSWNFGFGVELFKRVQVGAAYGIGLTKALNAVGVTDEANINGRNRYWTITAAYMF